jgi:hypothetical protein
MRPTSPADLAFAGLIGPEDMSQRDWNAICRENGWEIIRNHGQGARRISTPTIQTASKAFCAFPGCGRWIAHGAEHCAAGHAQDGSQHAETVAEAIPF